MKYKRRIVTGAIALSLLVGSPTFAASTQYSNTHVARSAEHSARRDQFKKKANHVVGTVTGINGSVFTFETQAGKKKKGADAKTLSVDVQTQANTKFHKNGVEATLADLAVGQKVIVTGPIDAASQIVAALDVKIVTN